MNETLKNILPLATLVAGLALGALLMKQCNPTPVKWVTKTDTVTVHVTDYLPGEVKWQTRTQKVPVLVADPELVAMLTTATIENDSLKAALQRQGVNPDSVELVATGRTITDRYDLSQIFRYRDQAFGHTLKIFDTDTTKIEMQQQEESWLGKAWDWAKIGALAYAVIDIAVHLLTGKK